jgi:hypothetical protein
MAAAERGKGWQRSKTVGRRDGASGGISEWGTIEGVNCNVWVHLRWLGRMVAVREVGVVRRWGRECYLLGWAMFWGSEVRRQGVLSKLFLLSNLTAENTQDHSVLTEHKNLRKCKLFIFRIQLITILVGM